MQLTQRSKLGFAILIPLAIVVGWWYWSTRPTKQERFFEPTPDEQAIMIKAKKAYARFEMIPFDELASLEAVETIFQTAAIPGPQPVTRQIPAAINPKQLEQAKVQLRTVMAQFVHYRLIDPDLDRYLAWRHARGDEVKPKGEIYLLAEDYEEFFKEPMPPNMSSEQAFRRFYQHMESIQDPANTPIAISADPDAHFFHTWWEHPHIGPQFITLESALGNDFWIGNRSAGAGTWLWGSLDNHRFYRSTNTVLKAMGGVIVEYADGDRYPLVLNLHWDPNSAQWMIDGIIYANTDVMKTQRIMF